MKSLLFGLLVLVAPRVLFAHGEDSLGPNGGFIRMPGGFHTELKLDKGKLSIYLLDINWKNPTVMNSNVQVEYVLDKNSRSLECKAKEQHFVCSLPKDIKGDRGVITVSANREGMAGAIARYELPLRLRKQVESEVDAHSKH